MMKKTCFHVILIILLFLAGTGSGLVSAEETRTITDMTGRTVDIPSEVDTVLCNWLPSMMIVYMVAPDRLGAWNSLPGEGYFPEKYAGLPIIGRVSHETLLSMDPDIVVMGGALGIGGEAARSVIDEEQQKLYPLPVVAVTDAMDATAYTDPIRFIGELLGEEKQAEKMIAFYENILSLVTERVATIPDNERVRVYYAEGKEGLATDPAGSTHAALIDIAGGINVADFPVPTGQGQTEVSIEQVLDWDPEVILVHDPQFYATVRSDPLWQDITAVKTGRVYMIPKTTFNWFDRPTGLNQIIGIPWTAKILYPDRFRDMDLDEIVREYHELFLHISLSDDQIGEILSP